MATAFYTVRDSFITTIRGVEVEYHKGEVVQAGDPALVKMPEHFEPLVVRGHDVEQATAAPGEKRGKAITTASFKGRE